MKIYTSVYAVYTYVYSDERHRESTREMNCNRKEESEWGWLSAGKNKENRVRVDDTVPRPARRRESECPLLNFPGENHLTFPNSRSMFPGRQGNEISICIRAEILLQRSELRRQDK